MNVIKALELAVKALEIDSHVTQWKSDAEEYQQAADVLKTMLAEQEAMQRLKDLPGKLYYQPMGFAGAWVGVWVMEIDHKAWSGETPTAAINAAWEAYREEQS